MKKQFIMLLLLASCSPVYAAYETPRSVFDALSALTGVVSEPMGPEVSRFVSSTSAFFGVEDMKIGEDNIGYSKGEIIYHQGAFRTLVGSNNPCVHAAIDAGDGYLFEFSNTSMDDSNPRNATILRITRDEFIQNAKHLVTDGEPVYFYKKHVQDPIDADTVVARAWAGHHGHGEFNHHYDPLLNNCQHFAMWCKTGEKTSWQAEQIVEGIEALSSVSSGVQQAKPYVSLAYQLAMLGLSSQ